MPNLTTKQLKSIKGRIEAAVKNPDRRKWCDTVKRMRELYKGEVWAGQSQYSDIGVDSGDHQVTVNLAQVNVDIIVSSIAYADPEFQLTPQEPEALATVGYQKMALVKVWNEINALRAQQRRLKHGVIDGMGVNFVGWRYEEYDSEPQEGTRPAGIPQEGDLPTIMMKDGGLMAPPPEDPAESNTEVVYDNPIIRSVNPTKFYVDPDHDDLDDLRDAQWVMEEKNVPERAIKGNKRYSNTQDLKGEVISATDEDKRDRKKRDSEEKFVTIYEYWQKDGKRHILFAKDQLDKPLLEESWPYHYSTYPYTTLVYRDLLDNQYPQGAIQSAQSSIQTYNLYRTKQVQHDDVQARCLVGYDAGKVSADGVAALKSDAVDAMVECNGSPSEAIQPITLPSLSQDFYATQNGVKQDVSIEMAVDDYMRGTPDTTRRTLGEVNMTVSLSASRGQAWQRAFERACEKDANLVLQLLQDERFCDRKRWMTMTGEPEAPTANLAGAPGRTMGLDWTADTIKGQSDVRVICNSTRVQSPESVQQTMGFALQSLQPYVAAGQIAIAPFVRKLGQAINMTPQELEEAMNPQGGGQQQGQMEQATQQMMQQMQQMGQALQQTMQTVEELKSALGQGAVDQKTQVELAAKQQTMQADAEKHQLDMQIEQAKAQQELDAADQELQLKVQIAQQKMAQDEEAARIGQTIRLKEQEQKQTNAEVAAKANAETDSGEASKANSK